MRSQTDILVQAVGGVRFSTIPSTFQAATLPSATNFHWYMENPSLHVELVIFLMPPLCHPFPVYLITEKIKEQTVPFLGCAKHSLIKAANSAVFFLLRPASLNFSVKNSAGGTHSSYINIFFLQTIY